MKKLLAIIILSLCFITPSQADDIRDFQIEDISIGDSLLDYYSEYEIKEGMNYPNQYNSDEFKLAAFSSKNKTYDAIHFHVKKNDKKYKIYSISGQIMMNLNSCLAKKKKVFADLKSLFKNTEKIELGKRKHPGYKNSYAYQSYFKFNNGDLIEIACYDYGKKLNEEFFDKFTISLDSYEFNKFLLTAYN